MTLESEKKLIHYALNDREITEEQLLSLIILFALSQRENVLSKLGEKVPSEDTYDSFESLESLGVSYICFDVSKPGCPGCHIVRDHFQKIDKLATDLLPYVSKRDMTWITIARTVFAGIAKRALCTAMIEVRD